jgi:predicted nucleic acid-binding protein
MKLVVDTNVIFSAVIAGGTTRELLLGDSHHLDLAVPEFFFRELDGKVSVLAEKADLDEQAVHVLVDLLCEPIRIVPRAAFETELESARDAIAADDPDDVPFVALALHLDAAIWSDDSDVAGIDVVPTWRTHELLEYLE